MGKCKGGYIDANAYLTIIQPMHVNDTVKYSRPQPGEEDIRFTLREINGDRVLLELVCEMPIRPLETVPIDEICTAENCVAA